MILIRIDLRITGKNRSGKFVAPALNLGEGAVGAHSDRTFVVLPDCVAGPTTVLVDELAEGGSRERSGRCRSNQTLTPCKK
jgi:hypothetical protein